MSGVTEVVFPEIHRIAREAAGELVPRREVVSVLIERMRAQLERAWADTTQHGVFETLEAYVGNIFDQLTGPQWGRSGGGLRKVRVDGQWAVASTEALLPDLGDDARARIAERVAERRRNR